MKVKIKRLCQEAKVPTRAHKTDAGCDLYAVSKSYDKDNNVIYGTGLAFEIPEGYMGLLFPRSSNAKQDLLLSNSVGLVDAGYRGEVLFKFKKTLRDKRWGNFGDLIHEKEYEVGDRIGQIVIVPFPQVDFVEVDELSQSDRGVKGYGSSGK